jgi:hypothetical protein
MPTDYRTFPAIGIGLSPGNSDQSYDDFTHYDLYVRQTTPWLIAASFESGSGAVKETRVVCGAPDQVVGESRRPEGAWPPAREGKGTRMALSNKYSISLLVATISVLLMA